MRIFLETGDKKYTDGRNSVLTSDLNAMKIVCAKIERTDELKLKYTEENGVRLSRETGDKKFSGDKLSFHKIIDCDEGYMHFSRTGRRCTEEFYVKQLRRNLR